jgi:two-component system, response regulator
MLVEDGGDDAALTVRAFERLDLAIEIEVFATAEAALKQLRQVMGAPIHRVKPYALMLVDLALPGMSGIEFVHQVKADPVLRRLPIIVLTSSREDGDVRACYDAGANSYVRKPVDQAVFSQFAAQLAHYWLCLNEPPPGLQDR